MAKQILNTGTANNDKSGDTLRAGGLKIKANFNEIYAALANDGSNISGGDLLKSGSYTDLRNLPDFHPISTSGSFSDLEDKPEFSIYVAAPSTLVGVEGNMTGQIAADDEYVYICTADYLQQDNPPEIWKRIPLNVAADRLVNGDFEITIDEDGALTFPDGSVQTTAYTGTQAGPLFVVVNDDGNMAYSNDGESWTVGSKIRFNGVSGGISRVSVADDYIIYIGGPNAGEGDDNLLWYASSHLDSSPTSIEFASNLGETTGEYQWNDIQYGNGFTVAVGFFRPNEGDIVPAWAYTSNGSDWNLGSIDPDYQSEYGIGAEFVSVDYNGTGWLIVSSRTGQGDANVDGTGAFFITNLSNELTQDNFVVPNAVEGQEVNWNIDSVVWTGDRWWMRDSSGDGDESKGYIVSSGANPLDTTWIVVNVAYPSFTAGFGSGTDYWEDAGGTIEGVHWFVAANGNGQVIASSDGGDTWVASIPLPFTDTVASISDSNESVISFNGNGGFQNGVQTPGEKIVISNAVPSEYNGTYYTSIRGLLNSVYYSGEGNTNWVEGTYDNVSISMGVEITISITSAGQVQSTSVTNNGGVEFNSRQTFTIAGSTFGGTDGEDDMVLVVGDLSDEQTYLYTDEDLEVPFDTATMDPFESGDVLFSHGRYIDSLGFGLGKFIVGNDDEQLFTSTDLETWTKVNDQENSFEYWNDISFNAEYNGSGTTGTGSITFSGVEIRGVASDGKFGMIKLVPAVSATDGGNNIDFMQNGQYIKIYPTNQFDAPHIHITAGAGEGEGGNEGDLFLGDDERYVQVNSSGYIQIQSRYNNGESYTYHNWVFNETGSVSFPTLTVNLHNGGEQYAQTLQLGDGSLQAVITGPTPDADQNAERLIIQGQRATGTGEGGDVYVWAGDAEGDGGDIKIYAGDADNELVGYGGYVNIEGGSGSTQGGQVYIKSGSSATNGADVVLEAGYGETQHGKVRVQVNGNTWRFNDNGKLQLPIDGDIVDNNGTSVLSGGGGASTGDFTFTNAEIAVTDNASLTVTGNTVFTATIPSSGGMAWSESNSFIGTYTSDSLGYIDFSQFDGQKVIFFDNVMSTNLSTQLNAMAIGDTILVDDTPSYTVTLTSTFSSFMGRFIASVTSPESDRIVSNQVVITRTVSDTNEFQFKGNGELVAPKVVAATSLIIPSYTINECGFGRNTVAGTNGAIISVSDSDQDVSNPNMTAGYYPPNMLAYWVPTFNQNPPPGQEAGAWVYLHQTSSNYHLVGN